MAIQSKKKYKWTTAKKGRKAIPFSYTIWDALMAAGVPVRSGRKSQLRDKNAGIGVPNSAHKRLLAGTNGSAAVDITPLPGYTWDDVMVALADPDLQDYFAHYNIGFLDERDPKYLSWKITGPHFHIGVGAGTYKTPGSTGPGLRSWDQIYKVGNPYWNTVEWYGSPKVIGEERQDGLQEKSISLKDLIGLNEENPYTLPEVLVKDDNLKAWNTMLAANNTLTNDSPLLNTIDISTDDIDYHPLKSNPYTPIQLSSNNIVPLLSDIQTPYTDVMLGRGVNYAKHGGLLGNYYDGSGDSINRLIAKVKRLTNKPGTKHGLKAEAMRLVNFHQRRPPVNPLLQQITTLPEIDAFGNPYVGQLGKVKLGPNMEKYTDAYNRIEPNRPGTRDKDGNIIDPTNNALNWMLFGGASLARLGIGTALQHTKDLVKWLKPGNGGGNLIGTTAGAEGYDLMVQGLTGKTLGQNMHDITGMPEWAGNMFNPMWYYHPGLSADEQLLARLRGPSSSASEYLALQEAKRKASTVQKMKKSPYVPGIVRYSYDRGSLSAPIEYTIAHTPIGRRAIEMAMRSSRGGQAGNLNFTLPAIRNTLFGKGQVWKDRRNYLFFGKQGNPENRYKSFTGDYYGGIGSSDTFEPFEGYGDLIDAFLYRKQLDPRIARLIGKNYGTMEKYINTNYPHKNVPMYELNSKGVIDPSSQPIQGNYLTPLLKADTPIPQRVIGYPPNQDLLLAGERSIDVGGHPLIEGMYDNIPVYAEQDIWKFLPQDYMKKWFERDWYRTLSPAKKQLLKTGIYMVDEAGTPFVTKTPFAAPRTITNDLIKVNPKFNFNPGLFKQSPSIESKPIEYIPTKVDHPPIPLSELPKPEILTYGGYLK